MKYLRRSLIEQFGVSWEWEKRKEDRDGGRDTSDMEEGVDGEEREGEIDEEGEIGMEGGREGERGLDRHLKHLI